MISIVMKRKGDDGLPFFCMILGVPLERIVELQFYRTQPMRIWPRTNTLDPFV